jgi:hypothetical protein
VPERIVDQIAVDLTVAKYAGVFDEGFVDLVAAAL